MAQFEREKFEEALGSGFTLTAGDVTLELVLTQVRELRKDSENVAFSILFLAPENFNVPQGLYDMEHPSLGKLQLFLVPISLDKSRLRLEAVFNLLIENGS